MLARPGGILEVRVSRMTRSGLSINQLSNSFVFASSLYLGGAMHSTTSKTAANNENKSLILSRRDSCKCSTLFRTPEEKLALLSKALEDANTNTDVDWTKYLPPLNKHPAHSISSPLDATKPAAAILFAGLKSVDYGTRFVVLHLFLLKYRRPRGDQMLTYALSEQSLANRFFTIDPANSSRWHANRCQQESIKANRCQQESIKANRCQQESIKANRCQQESIKANRCQQESIKANRCQQESIKANRCQQESIKANRCQQESIKANRCQQESIKANRCQQESIKANRCQQESIKANRCQQESIKANRCQQESIKANRCQQESIKANRCQQESIKANRCQQESIKANRCQQESIKANRCQQESIKANRCQQESSCGCRSQARRCG
ncbi:hypothetical protein CSKR_107482 [Clonorchis sinensis]|uniref:Uncharacterized protein n=1 Tax=Clonorchis sinensis TaxID=79923 RepID=A0A3R7FHK0_CLOSI|nr:hypothetical protein CSKR_107482 [Clonorchis sinensis]